MRKLKLREIEKLTQGHTAYMADQEFKPSVQMLLTLAHHTIEHVKDFNPDYGGLGGQDDVGTWGEEEKNFQEE